MSDYLLSIIAIVVSIAAIVFSVCYNRKSINMTKEHFKKSVKPLMHIWRESFPEYFKLSLKNGGTGPAILKKIVLNVNNKSYETMDELFKDRDNKVTFENYNHNETRITHIENFALVPNGEVPLFEYHFLNQKGREEFIHLLSKAALIVEYETIYKEPDTLTENPISTK